MSQREASGGSTAQASYRGLAALAGRRLAVDYNACGAEVFLTWRYTPSAACTVVCEGPVSFACVEIHILYVFGWKKKSLVLIGKFRDFTQPARRHLIPVPLVHGAG